MLHILYIYMFHYVYQHPWLLRLHSYNYVSRTGWILRLLVKDAKLRYSSFFPAANLTCTPKQMNFRMWKSWNPTTRASLRNTFLVCSTGDISTVQTSLISNTQQPRESLLFVEMCGYEWLFESTRVDCSLQQIFDRFYLLLNASLTQVYVCQYIIQNHQCFILVCVDMMW